MGSELFVHFGVGAPPVVGEDVKAAVGEDAVEATSEQAKKQGASSSPGSAAGHGRGERRGGSSSSSTPAACTSSSGKQAEGSTAREGSAKRRQCRRSTLLAPRRRPQSPPYLNRYAGSLRPCLGTTIALLRRAASRQALLVQHAGDDADRVEGGVHHDRRIDAVRAGCGRRRARPR